MTNRQQSRRRRAPHRLLLLAGFGLGAGLGVALSVGSPAQAADQPPAPTLGGAVTGIVHTVTELPAKARDHVDTKAHRPVAHRRAKPTERPRQVRDLAAGTRRATTQAVQDTGRTVKHVTGHVDDAAQPLPLAGQAVGQVTDLTDTIVDTITTPRPAAPAGLSAIPHVLDDLAAIGRQALAGTPQTAPELTPPDSPTPAGVNSGAPTAAAAQFPQAPSWSPDRVRPHTERHSHHQAAIRRADGHSQTTPGAQGTSGASDDGAQQTNTPNTRTFECTPTGTWAGVHRWHQAVTDYLTHHAGRTQPPTPPSG